MKSALKNVKKKRMKKREKEQKIAFENGLDLMDFVLPISGLGVYDVPC